MNKSEIKKKFVQALSFKTVSIDEAYPNLQKTNFVLSENIETPEAVQMPFLENARNLQVKIYKTPEAYTAILNNVFYSADYNVLLTRKKEVIIESFLPHRKLEDYSFIRFASLNNAQIIPDQVGVKSLFRYLPSLKSQKICHIPETCIILDQLTQNNYYHRIIDNIPRFKLACQHEIVSSQREIKLIHTTPVANDFFLSQLVPDNITPLKLTRGRLYHIEKIVFSTFVTRQYSGCIPSFLRNAIYTRFLPNRPCERTHRIYISRQEGSARRIINEKEFLMTIQKFGFKKYVLEDLPIQEQIELFYDADVVIAAHGAGLTNLIFSNQSVKVFELFQGPLVSPHYYFLCKSMGHEYQYWCSQNSNIEHWHDFEVNTAEIVPLLEDLIS